MPDSQFKHIIPKSMIQDNLNEESAELVKEYKKIHLEVCKRMRLYNDACNKEDHKSHKESFDEWQKRKFQLRDELCDVLNKRKEIVDKFRELNNIQISVYDDDPIYPRVIENKLSWSYHSS